ncbi:MAG: ComF family protein [Clostridia bacterium]|nr:ComF family protein [Clostridia bacterium]MBQ1895381.1 ComF family protein [Clostridia bacterium]MBQ2092164.1 ComF family protein [Clostridia bacterium]MBQ2499952.1 ComF family protein [Clostridia bacterium]MBQ3897204.1 ComF family protein [Clostridia bacterium]
MSKSISGAEKLLNLVFPEKCISCGEYISDENRPGDFLLAHFFCGECAETITRPDRELENVASPLLYDGAVKNAMQRLKFSSDISSAPFFAAELEREVRAKFYGLEFDILTCVPATRASLAERGYNQSRLIAEQMRLGCERDCELLRKSRDTQVQHLLDAEHRQKNIESAYSLNRGRSVVGKRILLVDDILTTGATCKACARVLLFSGAKSVHIACATLTPRK